jgi:hypothetical protein
MRPEQQKPLEHLEQQALGVRERLEALEEEYRSRKQELQNELRTAVLACHQAGIPVSKICVAYGTTNRHTIYEIIRNANEITKLSKGDNWSMIATGANTYIITVEGLGPARWSGTANIEIRDGEILTDTPPFQYNSTDNLKRQILEAHNANS